MLLIEIIKSLTAQLYPTGRAFKGPEAGWLRVLHDEGMAPSETVAAQDALNILDAILPDNPRFTTDDCTDWERRLGLITNIAVSREDRMAAIRRKSNHPGTIKARQHYLYVQAQLRAAGFDVYVYENRFDDGMGSYYTRNPVEIIGGGAIPGQHGQFQHGQRQHGGTYQNKVVNYIDERLDANFNVGSNLRSTFFIGGAGLGNWAYVPIARKAEFRQLILKLKPAQTVAFLFVIYV